MNQIARWLENLNLLPFVLVISAWHYVEVLKQTDPLPVAIAFAILFDLGHFQMITLAIKYIKRGASSLFGTIFRLFLVLLTTSISFHYHFMYYAGRPLVEQLAYSLPLPVFVMILAWYYEYREGGVEEDQSLEGLMNSILNSKDEPKKIVKKVVTKKKRKKRVTKKVIKNHIEENDGKYPKKYAPPPKPPTWPPPLLIKEGEAPKVRPVAPLEQLKQITPFKTKSKKVEPVGAIKLEKVESLEKLEPVVPTVETFNCPTCGLSGIKTLNNLKTHMKKHEIKTKTVKTIKGNSRA